MPYPMQTDLDLLWEYVKEHGRNPRIHPNGFIQLDIGPVAGSWEESHQRGHSGANERLHIWNPPGIELPRQETVNEIHDHVFDMRSLVMKGRLLQTLYNFDTTASLNDLTNHIAPTHEKYRAVYGQGGSSRLESTGELGWLRKNISFWVEAGQSYTQNAFTLHDSTADGLVVTRMTKVNIHDGDATVICPLGQPPDNEFDRAKAMDPDILWKAIERSLKA